MVPRRHRGVKPEDFDFVDPHEWAGVSGAIECNSVGKLPGLRTRRRVQYSESIVLHEHADLPEREDDLGDHA